MLQRPNASLHAAQSALGNGTVAERRAQIEHEESLLRAERQLQIEAQRSTLSPARDRIHLWEQLHGLDLPRASGHKLLSVIAMQTELSLADIHQEQSRRSGSSAKA